MSNVGHHLLSGGLSGLASTVLLQPLDLMKTRLQQGDGLLDKSQKHVLNGARDILRKDGIRGFWRGTVPSLFRNVPGVALYMTSLTHIRALMSTNPLFVGISSENRANSGSTLPKLASHGNILAGAVTRVSVGFVLNPFSVLKTRYESNIFNNKYRSFPSAFTSILRSGPNELFKGVIPSAIRDAPYAGIFVAAYESIKRRTSKISTSDSDLAPSLISSTGIHTLSAASAGAIATMVTHPFDVIKTKIQVRHEDRYHGFFRTIWTIWHQRGVTGFLDGISLRMARKVCSSAIGWAVYEGMLMLMNDSSRHAFKL